jgi:putative ABC transport system permease protein
MRELWNRLQDWLRRDRLTSELDEELRFHRRMLDDPRRLGNATRIIEDARDIWSIRWLDVLAQDLRYALRVLRRSPGFTAVVVLTLALGIGANTAIFSVWTAVLLPELPYRDADRLVAVSQLNSALGQPDKVTAGDFTDWKARSRSFDGWGFYWDTPHTLTGTDTPQSVFGVDFSSNFFALLGASPLLGRTFAQGEGEPGKDRVVVLSHHLWQSAFGGDPLIIGRTIRLDGDSYEVIGVMPASFAHPFALTDLWTPAALADTLGTNRQLHFLRVVGRLRAGVTLERARNELASIARQASVEYAATNRDWTTTIVPIRDSYSPAAQRPLWIVQAAVLIVLLIACANVANLLLTRASTREHEVAVRLALGTGRARLFSHFMMQGTVLALAGAASGVLLAVWGVQSFPRLFESQLTSLALPTHVAEWIDWRVLGATLGLALVIGAFFGAVPALRLPPAASATLRSGGRGSGSVVAVRLRSLLMIVQVALSLLLLVASGLLIRSFVRLQSESLGFRPERLLTMQLVLPRDRYATTEKTSVFLDQALERIRAVPGVEAAGAVNTLPLTGYDARRRYAVAGAPTTSSDEQTVYFRVVTPEYFRAMSIPLRTGRVFSTADGGGGDQVAVINETFARRLWPNDDPVGRTIEITTAGAARLTIVGVVADVRHNGLAEPPEPELYRVAAQSYWPFFGIVVRTTSDPELVRGAVERAIWSIDPAQPIDAVQPMERLAGKSIALRRASMLLLTVFAVVALAVASLGIYGVVSYAVARRSREIAVRLALGAQPSAVLRQALGEGLIVMAIGMSAGVAAAVALTRFLGALLFGVTPTDALTLVLAIGTLGVVGLVATIVPARRAARTDPMEALRNE